MGVNPSSHRVDRGSYRSSNKISGSQHSGSSSSSSSSSSRRRRVLLLLLISATAWVPTAAVRHHGQELHSAAVPRGPNSAGSPPGGPTAAMAVTRRSETSHRQLGEDVPQECKSPSRRSRCEQLVLMLRGGKGAEGDWTTSTPDDDELGQWSRGSSVADDGLNEDDEESLQNIPDGLDEQSSPLSEQSTGLGIHQVLPNPQYHRMVLLSPAPAPSPFSSPSPFPFPHCHCRTRLETYRTRIDGRPKS